MTDIWFDRDLGRISRRGALLYVARPEGIWAALTTGRTFEGDLAQESAELLGLYGAAVHGIGHLLLSDDVRLPPDLEQWAIAPRIPMAELGGWVPALLSLDGQAYLSLARGFGDHRAYAATLADGHLAVVAPAAETPLMLVST